jgi:hypothetical protein
VDNFLSDYETNQIIKLAQPGMGASSVGEADAGIQNRYVRVRVKGIGLGDRVRGRVRWREPCRRSRYWDKEQVC